VFDSGKQFHLVLYVLVKITEIILMTVPAERVAGYPREEWGRKMPRVNFTSNIQRHVRCPSCEAQGNTLRDVLNFVFEGNPQARGYVLDDQGAVRKHMAVFVNGQTIKDRVGLTDLVPADAEVYIMQALSGG